MELNRKQFQLMTSLIDGKYSQRRLSLITKFSLGSINSLLKELTELGLLTNNEVNAKGYEVLEQYRVKRAVFIAAGFGSRMVPVTLTTPKPLVKVNGKRIIDGLIDACLAADIKEIYIVRGYLGEKFDVLLEKYPMIKFLENPIYNEANNISSSLVAKDLLENAYVFEADLVISNPHIITKYNYRSNFLAIKTFRTDDWCFEVTKNNHIKKEKIGGFNCYQMVGISYWNKEDGIKLSKDIEEAFNMPGGKEKYWEQVPLDVFKGKYKVSVRECKFEDIVEIDTYKELQRLDKSYK